ncbi:MAG: isochorismate synthase MenF [Planctomycetota bacterium]
MGEVPAGLPLAWVGGAFHPEAEAGLTLEAWQGWPAAELWVPAELLHEGPAGSGWVGQAASQAGDEGVVRRELNRRATAWAVREEAETPGAETPRAETPRAETPGSSAGGAAALDARDLPARDEWLARCEEARARLDGDLRKLVLARARRLTRASGPAFDPFAALARLAAREPDATLFAWSRGDACFLGATPETLLEVAGGALTTHALAGTAARGAPAEDAARGAALLACAKTQREHGLVVAGVLAALADDVRWEDAAVPGPEVRALGGVLHLETPLRGALRPGAGALDLVERLHPTPALGGDPAPAAREWLARREGLARGWYGGPLGWIAREGDARLVVAIRSALVRGHEAWAYAGAGIVPASDPVVEWDETELKLRPAAETLSAQAAAGGGGA